MKNRRKLLKDELHDELKHVTFTKQKEVIERIRPVTWKQKWITFLNKEIELSLLPVASFTMFIFLLVGISYKKMDEIPPIDHPSKEIIEIDGYVYWKDQLEALVKHHED